MRALRGTFSPSPFPDGVHHTLISHLCFPYITTRGISVFNTRAMSCANFPSPRTAAAWNCFDIDLIEDFAGGGQRFDEDGLFVGNGTGSFVQIFNREREVFGESAVVIDDAEDGAARAVRFQSAETEFADAGCSRRRRRRR